MMGFRTLAFTYVLGGLTFLPIVFAALLTAAWCLLPRIQHAEKSTEAKSLEEAIDQDAAEAEQKSRRQRESISDAGASGMFAVLRQYDFSSAVGALNTRNNTGNNADINADGSLVADSGTSESVYQSMYRSVFSGNRNASSSTLLDSGETQQNLAGRRKAVPANVLYIVLRHGHLMLYDSPAQVQVKHVISLAHHRVTLQADKDGVQEGDERHITEADLFTKRTAIVLMPVELPNGVLQPSSQKSSRPFYLFCATNIDKEDFYHALLAARTKPPIPRPIDTDALITLQSALHSSSLTPETRALSALLGRVFLGISKTNILVDFVRGKIEKKLRKIQKPTFIPLLEIRSLDLGDAGPVVSNLKLKDLNISGDMTISADIKYNGGLSLTLLAVAKLDLGPRFKARTVDLILKTTLHRVSGTMLLRVKPAPSNRIWFTFETMPDLDIRVEPVVSERKITYGFVLRAIEERVRAAFGEGLVKPNWDDIPMPLQDTRGSYARGGVWTDVGEEDHPRKKTDAAHEHNRHEKRLSTSTLPEMNSATSTGLTFSSESNLTKPRHTSTMPTPERHSFRRPTSALKDLNEPVASSEKSTRPPKPLRSPSISAMSASVLVDDQTAERADDSSIRGSATPPSRLLWRSRGSPSFQQTQKDALEELRDLRDRAEQAITKPSAVAIGDSESARRLLDPVLSDDGDARDSDSVLSRQHSEGSESTIADTPRSFSLRSADLDVSSNPPFSSSNLPKSQQQQQQKKTTILAAAGAATNAARNWGWNTIQKNKSAFQRPGPRSDLPGSAPNEPMGRGQPLPPPGVPLPGPQKGIWGGMNSMRRKPVPALPPRRPRPGEQQAHQYATHNHAEQHAGGSTRHDGSEILVEDEFGTWHQNAGATGSEQFEPEIEAAEMDGNVVATKSPAAEENGHVHPTFTPVVDLLDLGDEHVDSSPGSLGASTLQTPKTAPPPLPARRSKLPAESEAPLADSASEDQPEKHHNHLFQANDSTTEGLRVPESAASTIAAENSTPQLALGAADDPQHINMTQGVEAQVQGGESSSTRTPEEETKDFQTRERSNTQRRFVQGEDVTEDDFVGQPREHVENQIDGGQEEGATNDVLAQRIKGQVQKHEISQDKGWHSAPHGTAVESGKS